MCRWKSFGFFLLLLPGLGHADLPSLMAHLATLPHPPRHFTEQRHSELLVSDLTLRGTLIYSDGRLVKAIEEPFHQRFTIEGENLIIEQGEAMAPQRVALTEQPLLSTFVILFRATLQGDLTALQQHYLVSLAEGGGNWRLTLRPRAADVAVYLKQVTIKGDSAGAQRFHIEEQGGDSSTMELGGVAQ